MPADTTPPDHEVPVESAVPEIPAEATMPDQVPVELPPTSGVEDAEAVADRLLDQPPLEPSSVHPDQMQTLPMETVEEWPPQPQHPKTCLLRWKKPYTTKSYDQYGNQVGEQESTIPIWYKHFNLQVCMPYIASFAINSPCRRPKCRLLVVLLTLWLVLLLWRLALKVYCWWAHFLQVLFPIVYVNKKAG